MSTDKVNFGLLSLNVRGLNNKVKRKYLFNWLKKQNADVIFLQEVHCTLKTDKEWNEEWGSEIVFSHGTSNARGTAILFKKDFDIKIVHKEIDSDGRYIFLDALIENCAFKLLNVYFPTDENGKSFFLGKLSKLLQTQSVSSDDRIIIGGDFNCVIDPKLDKKGGCDNSLNAKKEKVIFDLKILMKTNALQDIWRIKNPTQRRFTWRQTKPLIQCRLDFWLTSEILQDEIQSVDIKPAYKTDHSAITIRITSLDYEHRGPGYWKLNTSLLLDEEYCQAIKQKLPLWKDEFKDIEDKRLQWDLIKWRIREYTKQFAKNKAKLNREKSDILESKLISVEKELASVDKNDEEILREYVKLKNEIENINDKRTKGLIIRSKAKWIEEGEKGTKYFFGLEKRNFQQKNVSKLKLDNGKITTCQTTILKEQRRFYQELYKAENEVICDSEWLIFENNIKKLDKENQDTCEGLLTLEECTNAMDTLAIGKTPGNDGIPVEFYKTFWKDIGQYLTETANAANDFGSFSTSQKQAVIILIEKPNKDRTLIKNWRPISLLNVDYKIVTKALSKRLEQVLPYIIHENQSGYVKGRFIGEAVRTISDVLTYTDENNLPGMLLSIDFEKAFDSVSWKFLNKILQLYNFGPSFQRWIRIIYSKDISSCILNKGHSSGYFNINRGVRQGDPISALLFVLGVEVIAATIRAENGIKGIIINGSEQKLVQYADDTTIFLRDINSVKNLIQLMYKYERISGLHLNVDKTKAMWLGSLKHSDKKPLGLNWTKEPIKTLGVYIGYENNLIETLNFQDRLKKLKAQLNIWRQRSMSIYGRILIVKTLAISKFVYLASVIHIPEWVIKNVEKEIYNFIWKGKQDKVKRKVLINKVEKGGLGMVDFRSTIHTAKVMWVKRFLAAGQSQWKDYFELVLEPFGGRLLFSCNYDFKYLNAKLPKFYEDILLAWSQLKSKTTENITSSPGIEVIWNNKHVKHINKSLFSKKFLQAGILYVEDLFDENGVLKSFQTWVDIGELTWNDYFFWVRLQSSIPKTWKQNILDDNQTVEDPLEIKWNGNNYPITKLTHKMIYDMFVTKIALTSPISKATISDLNVKEEDEISLIYLLPHKTGVNNAIKELQYKILNKYLAVNVYLTKIKLKNSDLCSFGCNQQETVNHLFFSCEKTQTFWRNLFNEIEIKTQTKIEYDLKSIILGHKQNFYQIDINYIILSAKYYIYRCKLEDSRPLLSTFIKQFKRQETIDIERIHIYSKRSLMKLWKSPLLTALTAP